MIPFEIRLKQLHELDEEEYRKEMEEYGNEEAVNGPIQSEVSTNMNTHDSPRAYSASHPSIPPSHCQRSSVFHEPYPVSPYEREKRWLKEEMEDNRFHASLEKSRREMDKINEDRRLEADKNKLRASLSYKEIKPLPEDTIVEEKFPLHVFPHKVVQSVLEVSASIQVVDAAVAIALLGAIFVACRGNFVIEVTRGYVEALTAFLLGIMPSGTRKSAIVGFFRQFITAVEADRQRDYDADYFCRKIEIDALIALKKKYQSEFIKDCGNSLPANFKMHASILAKKLEPIEREIQKMETRPKFLIDSPTPKEMAMEMARQDESIGVYEAEAGLFKSRLRAANDDIFLKGYTMESFGDETSTGNSVSMERPCLAICSFVQNSVAESLYSNEALKDHGFVPRILPAFLGCWQEHSNLSPIDISNESIELFSNKISSLLNISRPKSLNGERTFHTLKLTEDARKKCHDYSIKTRVEIQRGFYPGFESFAEKKAGHAIRLAGALHALEYDIPQDHELEAKTIDGGISLAEFFAKHVSVSYDENRKQSIKFARKILNWMGTHKRIEFTERQAQRGVGHCTIVDIRAGLDILEQHRFIGRHFTTEKVSCIVNPNHRFD